MKKKGFTLIELLAVIVVIGIITVITVPTIIGVIEKTKKASYKDTVYGIIESARIYLASNQDITKEIEFVCNEEECKRTNGDKLEFKGTVPKSGSIYIKEDGSILVESLYNGRYYANNETGEVVITEDDTTLTRGELTNIIRSHQQEINNLKNQINSLNESVGSLKSTATSIDEVYPVGSIYISTSEINPSDLFKGTEWERYSEGRTLVGEGDGYTLGSTGGTSTIKLALNQIPSLSVSGTTASTGSGMAASVSSYANVYREGWTSSNGYHSHSISTNASFTVANGQGSGVSGIPSGASSWGGYGNAHWFSIGINADGAHTHVVGYYDYYANGIAVSGLTPHTHTFTGAYTNSNQQSINIQNPYVVVYMWKRIA